MLDRHLRKIGQVLVLVLGLLCLSIPTVRAETHPSTETVMRGSIEDIGASINRACIAIGRKHYQQAATDLREAAESLDRDATLVRDNGKTRLERDAAALRAIASEVEKGQPIDCYSLRQQFSQVHADLASHRYAQAAQAWARKEFGTARLALARAARSVDQGLDALGEKSSAKLSAVLSATEHLARKSDEAAEAAFRATRTAVSEEIEKLRHAIQAGKSRWPRQSPFDQGA